MKGKTIVPTLPIDLNSVEIDVSLAQRLPYALWRYYLALPLGQDNDSVSVAMAYPENVNARQVISRLLKAHVVPVFTPAELLLPRLEGIYCQETRMGQEILAWYDQPEWKTAVSKAASLLSETLQLPANIYADDDLSLDEILKLAGSGRYHLIVLPSPVNALLSTVLTRAATPLFFVRGQQAAIKHILVVMRGFASDEQAIDWLAPFVRQQQGAITLLPLVMGSRLHWHPYHGHDSPAGQQLERCVQRLKTEDTTVSLKYRFGNAVEQVVEEVSANGYDLLVLAAEAEGDFVSQVITAIDQHHAHQNRAIFVLKPPEPTSRQSASYLYIN